MIRAFYKAATVIAALIMTGSALAPAQAEELDVLKSKTIRVIIGAPPTGGTENYARPFVDQLQALLKDSSVRAQNLDGGLGAMALMEAQGSSGSAVTLVIIHNGPLYSQIMGNQLAEFDLTKFHWVGALTNNQRIAFGPKGGQTTVEGLKGLGRQPVTAAESAGAPGYIENIIVSALTSLNLKVIAGIKEDQRNAMLLAGDIDFGVGSYASQKPLLDSGDAVPVFRIGVTGYPEQFANVPTLRDVVSPGASLAVVGIMEDLNALGRLVAAAPSTDPADVEALRVAFDRITTDPAVKKIYESKDLLLEPTSGKHVDTAFRQFLGGTDAQKELLTYFECGKKASEDFTTKCGG
jgi:tripartite-type tricarboxylate transporter receptor subunit TctC